MEKYGDLMILLAVSTFTDEHISRAISGSESNHL